MAKLKSPIELETAFETYTLDEILGEGGVGRVYGGRDGAGNDVAVKCLTVATSDKRRRFKNEIAFLAKNSHQNIVTVSDYGISKTGPINGPYYVMKRYDGSMLDHIANIDPKASIELFIGILDGVEAAHLKGVVHRDLKPENILMERMSNRPVIADFGIARFQEEMLLTAVETQPTQRLANFQYAAPEQRARGLQVDERADIYAAGLILNELFTGQVPYGTAYTSISSVSSEHSYLDRVVEQLIRQSPSDRPRRISDVKALIAKHHGEHVSRQKISRIDATVIPQGEIDDPLALTAPTLVGAEWRNGTLTLRLDTTVNAGWEQALKHGMGGHTAVLGAGPESFHFSGNLARVAIPEHSAQNAIDYFKQWLPRATIAYKQSLQAKIDRDRHQEQERLRREREEEERYQRVNAGLRI